MKVVPLSDQALQEATSVIHAGGLVVYPTETAYGLAADPFNPDAVQKVFSLKGRNDGKPLGLIAANREQVEEVVVIIPEAEPLLKYWPGPLSLVLPINVPADERKRQGLILTAALGTTLSVRISSHPFARALAEAVGHAIIATSANKSGESDVYNIQTFLEVFPDLPQPDLVIDAGTLPQNQPSTVVAFRDGRPVVLRQGPIEIKQKAESRKL